MALRSHVFITLTALTMAAAGTVLVRAAAEPGSAAEAIRAAVVSRVGGDVEVTVLSIDPRSDDLNVRDAKPDPSARLGKPMKFVLVTRSGAAVPVTASIEVMVTHAIAREPIGRGHAVDASAVVDRRTPLTGLPLTRVLTRADVIGTRALRPIAAGLVMLPAFVAARRVVEAGDKVTVVALVGAVEVSATYVAADGGALGDTIRVRNPETRRYIRGRIVKAGVVEVIHER